MLGEYKQMAQGAVSDGKLALDLAIVCMFFQCYFIVLISDEIGCVADSGFCGADGVWAFDFHHRVTTAVRVDMEVWTCTKERMLFTDSEPTVSNHTVCVPLLKCLFH